MIDTNTLAGGQFVRMLRESGYRATPGRLSLLQVLAKAEHPMAIHEIVAQLGTQMNQATVYRALEALADVGIVRRVDLQHAHAHYELSAGERHHHHLICRGCGLVEDVESCDVSVIAHTVLKGSKKFAAIHDHSLEFFGLCKKCSAKK